MKCTECGKPFKPKKSHQIICLADECKRARNYRTVKEFRERQRAKVGKQPRKKKEYDSYPGVAIVNQFLLRG